MIKMLQRELIHAVRDLCSKPLWALLVIAVLTCGLSSVLFSLTLINGLLIRPLPYPDAAALHVAGLQYEGSSDIDSVPLSDAIELKRRMGSAIELSFWANGTLNLTDGARAERFDGGFADASLFDVLRVKPLIGIGFTSADAVAGAPLRVLLSEKVWESRYLRDPAVLGRVVRVNGSSAEIIGVLPAEGSFPQRTELWIPTRASQDKDLSTQILLRMQPEQALAAMNVLATWLREMQPARKQLQGAQMQSIPLARYTNGDDLQAILSVMLAVTLLVLLIACGNTASLMLSRQLAKRQELAVRAAIGASRLQLTLHLLLPAMLLSLIAAVLSWPIARMCLQWVLDTFDDGPPTWIRFDIDPLLLLCMFAAALLTGLLSGLWPAAQLAQHVSTTLRDGGRGALGGGLARAGGWLVAIEIALSAALLIGALAMVREVNALRDYDLGVRTEQVLTARIGLVGERFAEPATRLAFWQSVLDRAAREPGVKAATVTSSLPGIMSAQLALLPEASPISDAPDRVRTSHIGSGFAETLGTTLLQGRWFASADRVDTEAVAIVDRTFMERFAAAGNPLGKRFRLSPGEADERVVTVIGVIERLTLDDVDDQERPSMLLPLAQDPLAFATLVVKSDRDAAALKPALVRMMLELDKDTPLYWVRTYDEVIQIANVGHRVLTSVYGSFGLIALLIAAGGLYGVVGASVQQRTAEIGVRRALGASSIQVLQGVLRRIGLQVGAGLLVGLGLGIPMAWSMLATISGERSVGNAVAPSLWLSVAALLIVMAVIAALIPAMRALRVAPSVALRGN